MKKKMLEEIFPHLKTNEDGVATYKGAILSASAGPCMAKNLPNANIA
jgi:aminoacyl tRNA synthase complex-interacting multifunctional protein 1